MSQGFLPFDTAPDSDPGKTKRPEGKPGDAKPSPGMAELFETGAAELEAQSQVEPVPSDAPGADAGPAALAGSEGARERDARARRRVQSVFDRPIVLEAGAGTGKTATLVARIIAWASGPGWERARDHLGAEADDQQVAARALSRVTSITFTEAAAADMADRVARALGTIGNGELPPGIDDDLLPPAPLRSERARKLSLTLEHLEVSTIHAYCRRLLGEATFEAGLHPAFEVDPEFEQCARVTREVLEAELAAIWSQEYRGAPHEHLALAAEGYGPSKLEELLFELVIHGTPVRALAQDPLAATKVGPRLTALKSSLDELLAILSPAAREVRQTSKLVEVAEMLGNAYAALDSVRPEAFEPLVRLHAVLKEVFGVCHKRLADWAGDKLSQEESRALDKCEFEPATLARAAGRVDEQLRHLGGVEPQLLRSLCTALAPLLDAVYEGLRVRGIETFDGLLQKTARLLNEHPEIASRIRGRTDLLCVDEFQDTDRLQYEILGRLALDPSRGPLAAPPPALFLVGDPKQSIYGWRNADLSAYDAFVERVEGVGGEVHALVVNFRSVPAVLDEVERVLGHTMRKERGIQPAFASLLPAPHRVEAQREHGEGPLAGRSHVEYWVSWNFDAEGEADVQRGQATELEARAFARELAELGAKPGFQWREAALLLRSMTDLDVYLGALREAGVPYIVERDRSYYRRREIVEAVAWLNAALRPHDTLALVSFLRSVHVGVPDAAWIPLWAHDFPAAVARLKKPEGDAMENLERRVCAAAQELEGLPRNVGLERVAGWTETLLEALRTLAELRRTFQTESVASFVALLREGLTLELTESARFLGAFRVANLDRFFRDLEARFEAERGDHHAVLRGLNRDVHLKREATEARPKESVDDAVRVMTFHMSKGLDFRHVYLGQLHKHLQASRFDDEVVWEPVADGFEFSLRGVKSYGFDQVEARRGAVEAAERLRLLYVAMTRAEDRLVLMGAWPEVRGRVAPGKERSLIDLLARRDPPPPDLGALAAELAAEGAGARRDVGGAAWCFPDLGSAAAERRNEASGDASQDPEALEPATVAQFERDTAAWCERVQLAEQHASREWSLAATQLEASGRHASSKTEGTRSALPPALAQAVGIAVHRELELYDTALGDHIADVSRDRMRAALAQELDEAVVARALDAAVESLARFVGGSLGERFRTLSEHVLARELAVWLPPASLPEGIVTPGGADRGPDAGPDAGPETSPETGPVAPVGYVSGRVDLVYRDPDTGEVVVADYKTDDLTGEAECQARAELYRAQAELYGRALQEGLGLEHAPRLELWFLAADLVVELSA